MSLFKILFDYKYTNKNAQIFPIFQNDTRLEEPEVESDLIDSATEVNSDSVSVLDTTLVEEEPDLEPGDYYFRKITSNMDINDMEEKIEIDNIHCCWIYDEKNMEMV